MIEDVNTKRIIKDRETEVRVYIGVLSLTVNFCLGMRPVSCARFAV